MRAFTCCCLFLLVVIVATSSAVAAYNLSDASFSYERKRLHEHNSAKNKNKNTLHNPLHRTEVIPDCQNFPWANKSRAAGLLPGMALNRGESITSKNAILILQQSGDLQLIRKRDSKLLWQANSTGGVRATFDGQLSVQNDVGDILFATPVGGGAILQLQHDCNLVIYGVGAFTQPLWASGTQVCIRAHIVPHSHDDVGWLLKPERYFDGCRTPGGGVNGTLNTVMQMLIQDPNRTYTQVESYFFHRWWQEQSEPFKDVVRGLVQNGQLDFTNGGWSMHDEACVHQESAIANMEAGAQFLKEQFGDALKLKIGWHIDPFGHASTTPRIMAQMGFDAFFFWRQDDQQRQFYLDTKQMETVWRPSKTLGGEYNMFTSIMYNSYCEGCGSNTCPGGFCCMDCEVFDDEQAARDESASVGVQRTDSFGSYEAHTAVSAAELERTNKQKLAQKQQDTKAQLRRDYLRKHTLNSDDLMGGGRTLLDAFAQRFQHERFMKTSTSMSQIDKLVNRRSAAKLDYSIGGIAGAYADMIREYQGGGFRTNNVLIPWGCDFAHDFADQDYPIMDQIIAEINSNPDQYGMELLYSSPRRYVQEVAEFDDDIWPENNDDFFVYADSNHSYWSGYFTSRAEYKGYERWLMAKHRAAETALVAGLYPSSASAPKLAFEPNYEKLSQFRQVMGIAQHHDSITGTERTHVRNHYQYLLDAAYTGVQSVFQANIKAKFNVSAVACPLANLSICADTQALLTSGRVDLIVYNNLAQTRLRELLTIPVPIQLVSALDFDTKTQLATQTVPTWRLTTTVDHSSPSPSPARMYQTYVQIPTLAPMSFKRIRLYFDNSSSSKYVAPSRTFVGSISNEHYSLSFNSSTYAVSGVKNIKTGRSSPLTQTIAQYCPHDNSYTHGSDQASGAYIFRTCSPTESPVPYIPNDGQRLVTEWVVGPLCSEVRQLISNSSNIQLAWRLCRGMKYVELTNGIGELQTMSNGVEVIQRLDVGDSVKSNGVWYTDSEALELQRRVRNSRPNYPYGVEEFVGSNFFPCNAFANIRDESGSGRNFAVVMDRSRAVASLHDGQIEMLIHRRLIYDDGRGVGQALDARVRVLSTSRLIFNADEQEFMSDVRFNSQLHTHTPHWFVGQVSSVPSSPTEDVAAEEEVAAQPSPSRSLLPANVHLHALTALWDKSLLVRFQHLFAAGESATYAVPAVVQLANILPKAITANAAAYTIVETDLLGVNPLAEMERIPFKTCRSSSGEAYTTPPRMTYLDTPKDVTSTLTLRPMEIRTFVIKKTNP